MGGASVNTDDVIKFLLGVLLAVVAYYARTLDQRLKDQENKMNGLPDLYARKDDVQAGFSQINRTLERIEDRLYVQASPK